MSIRAIVKRVLPAEMTKHLRRILPGSARARMESNRWLRNNCRDIPGKVLSIGSGSDADEEGSHYRDYFSTASSYTTSEVSEEFNCDLVLDVRSMPEIEDESYDCIFCSGVLEHTEDFQAGFDEMTRILKTGGILLLGLSFRYPIHMGEQDFWRFTVYGIKHLLKHSYEIMDMVPIDAKRGMEFPSAYWVKATKSGKV